MNLASVSVFYVYPLESDIHIFLYVVSVIRLTICVFSFLAFLLGNLLIRPQQFIQGHLIQPGQHNQVIRIRRCLRPFPFTYRLAANTQLFRQCLLRQVIAFAQLHQSVCNFNIHTPPHFCAAFPGLSRVFMQLLLEFVYRKPCLRSALGILYSNSRLL